MKRTLQLLLASLGLVTVSWIYIAFGGAPVAQSRPAAGRAINEIKPAQAVALGKKMISFVHFNDRPDEAAGSSRCFSGRNPARRGHISSIMTANVRADDWEAMKSGSRDRFIFVGKTSGRGQDLLRVALQRRTAVQIRDFFTHAPALHSLRFEMEMWEALAKHLSVMPVATTSP